ncbi:amidase [Bosea psychrotolerans]|uniref:Indoleacetamide hydrolase n=1 Tax=Bosea psychrotolerans TaxID=1871628 RepID=A0A2S4M3E6_9HYPH|nr:amidase family protein [Bosea psychrotolerans]POR49236.1 aspartyl-tRNA(Asn)/glutamyl-tRNA(Gln) amidotransferase subunit A [Bosea psychrotolerans]
MTAIADLSAIRLAAAVRAREVSPVEAVDAALARIEERRELNAFMAICAERARSEARAAEAAIMNGTPLGALHGVPFSIKDLTNSEGVATTQGSALFAGTVPSSDAVAVARARAAGAILIGKTTTPEFGHKPFTEGPFFGRTLNPWSHAHTCGGSSGGAAVAVAAGMGPLALGSDGGGSIRIPAACCGVVGLKATLGAIPNLQAPDLFGANSYVGPMARDVADTQLMFEVLVGPDRRDPYGQVQALPRRMLGEAERPRIGFLLRCGNVLDPEVERSVLAAMKQAEALGMIVEPIELDLVSLEPHFLVLLRSLLLARLGGHAARSPEKLDPTLIATIEAGRAYSTTDLCEAQFARTSCFSQIQAILSRFDLIASPTLSAPALPVGLDPLGRIAIAGRDAGTIRGAWYPYTFPFNLTGHPALSMPCGLSGAGLPIGLQLVGRWHEDGYLLAIAARLETALGFAARRPG